jgi:hypothetical protein
LRIANGNTRQSEVITDVIVVGCRTSVTFGDIKLGRVTNVQVDANFGVPVQTFGGKFLGAFKLNKSTFCVGFHITNFFLSFGRTKVNGDHRCALFDP